MFKPEQKKTNQSVYRPRMTFVGSERVCALFVDILREFDL